MIKKAERRVDKPVFNNAERRIFGAMALVQAVSW